MTNSINSSEKKDAPNLIEDVKVSIITATYNRASTIARCIASVYKQSHVNIEHIIVDGASKDNTLNVIKSCPNRISKIISEPDDGIYDAINKGIKNSSGQIIGTLNSDDFFHSSIAVEKIAYTFKQYPEIDCLYGNLIFVNENDKVVRRWESKHFAPGLFSKSWTPAHPTFYCRRHVYDNYGLYKTNYEIASDVEFMLRVLEVHQIKPFFLNEILVRMAMGGVSTSGLKSTITITREMQRAFKENDVPFNLGKYLLHKVLKISEFFKPQITVR